MPPQLKVRQLLIDWETSGDIAVALQRIEVMSVLLRIEDRGHALAPLLHIFAIHFFVRDGTLCLHCTIKKIACDHLVRDLLDVAQGIDVPLVPHHHQ